MSRYSRSLSNSPALNQPKQRVQQHIDEFVGIGLWLEQQKKVELEREAYRLKQQNDELLYQVDEERNKVQFLEGEKYNMQCMIEHLAREKEVSSFTFLKAQKTLIVLIHC